MRSGSCQPVSMPSSDGSGSCRGSSRRISHRLLRGDTVRSGTQHIAHCESDAATEAGVAEWGRKKRACDTPSLQVEASRNHV
jgi:hypothetical protein